MSKREFWEIVRADELVPDDIYTCDPRLKPANVDRLWRGGGAVTLYLSGDHSLMNPVSLAAHQPVFRRIPDAEDPRVLMEALKDLHETALTYAGFDAIGPLEGRIDQARRELESEGNRDQA